ncbi:MAG: 2,3-bisphosphoglycerate-independent phosphoglycerate mutase, partial [Planctomycetia bacterium]|nr:2,3-bisphosphoglycerate-independent phosphoglycerate mutase [Planctomycetia bacterium]
MKYAIVIPDGCADRPLDRLNGRTPLEVARVPHFDRIGKEGRLGLVRTVPENLHPGSEVAILSLLGYDPQKYFTGRAPIEAVGRGIELAPDEMAFRCNMVTVADGVMADYSAGHISTPEATVFIEALNDALGTEEIRFHPGLGYRHLMIYRGAAAFDLKTIPPHDIIDKPVADFMPSGQGAEILVELMDASCRIFDGHEVNLVRMDLGENPATMIWLWGEGRLPQLPAYKSIFGLQGAAITAVDIVRGLAKLIGWSVIEVEGATGYYDTDYEAKGRAAVAALDEYDIVMVHVEAT